MQPDFASLHVGLIHVIQQQSYKRLGRINAYASSREEPLRCTGEDAKQTYPYPSRADMDISHVLHPMAGLLSPALECDTNYSPPVAHFVDDAVDADSDLLE